MKTTKMKNDLRRLRSKVVNIALGKAHWATKEEAEAIIQRLWSWNCTKGGKAYK